MKKLLATLLASTMALATIGGLVACGGDDNNGGGANSDFYLVGSSAGSLFSGTKVEGWNPIGVGEAESRADLPDKLFFKTTDKADVYTITVDLYRNDQWCICDAKAGEAAVADEGGSLSGWDNQIKFEKGGISHGTEDAYMKKGSADFGDERNFVVAQGGKYEITYNVKGLDEDGIEVGTVTWKRTGDAAKIDMPEMDIYIKGNLASLNDWGHNFSADWKLPYNATTGEYTFDLVVSADDVTGNKEFGFAKYEKGASTGDGDFMNTAFIYGNGNGNDKFGTSGNFVPTEAGTYKLVIAFNGAWEINITKA